MFNMFNINVKRQLSANIDDVFKMLAEHQEYAQFKGIEASILLTQGENEPNGKGALREIRSAGHVLRERIVEYAPPTKLGYLIEYSKPLPYRHEVGIITLETNENGTEVIWQSRGRIAIPLLGKYYFDKQIERIGSRAFAGILKQIDKTLSA